MLEGRVALVTGSSRGLGRAIALELAQQGADVGVHCNRSIDEAQSVAERITAMGRRTAVVRAIPGNRLTWKDLLKKSTGSWAGQISW